MLLDALASRGSHGLSREPSLTLVSRWEWWCMDYPDYGFEKIVRSVPESHVLIEQLLN